MVEGHRCDACAVGEAGSALVVGQHLIHALVLADDADQWQQHLTEDSFATIGWMLERGSQIVVTSHERPMREIQAIALLLRSAGMPLQVLVNDGTTRLPVPFAMTGRSPLHLVQARGALRRGDSMLFVLWRAPMRPRGLLPWEAPGTPSRPAVGPVVLSRITRRPISLVRLEVAGDEVARLRLVGGSWEDLGGPPEEEASRLTAALEPLARVLADRAALVDLVATCVARLTGVEVELGTIPDDCVLLDLEQHGLSIDSIQLLELVVLLEEHHGHDLELADVTDDWSTYTWGRLLDDLALAVGRAP